MRGEIFDGTARCGALQWPSSGQADRQFSRCARRRFVFASDVVAAPGTGSSAPCSNSRLQRREQLLEVIAPANSCACVFPREVASGEHEFVSPAADAIRVQE